jgi:hypothetical protein
MSTLALLSARSACQARIWQRPLLGEMVSDYGVVEVVVETQATISTAAFRRWLGRQLDHASPWETHR